jgi:hypothetical protein
VTPDGSYEVGIGAVTVSNPGAMYASAPALSIAAGGAGCAGFRLEAQVTESGAPNTVFFVETDGGARLWVDDTPVIDAWDQDPRGAALAAQCAPGEGRDGWAACARRGALSCPEAGPYVSFSFEAGARRLASNGCPAAHGGGAVAREYVAEFPARPVLSRRPLAVARRTRPISGVIGWALDGVPFWAPIDEHGNDEVLKDWSNFDLCNGHEDATGTYHYHSNPVCTYTDAPGQHSPLAGFMIDGVPIFGLQGDGGEPPADLDECGGHVDLTHPFYHYHLVASFPYTVACLLGCIDAAALSGPAVDVAAQGPCIASAFQSDYSALKWPVAASSAHASGGAQGSTTQLRTLSGAAALAPGGLHRIRLEYKHESGAAHVRLSWSPGLGARRVTSGFSRAHPVAVCSAGGAQCGVAGALVVQAAAADAATSEVQPLQNLKASPFQTRSPGPPFDS